MAWRPVVLTTPWWRGPALLLRRPGVALALTAAAFVTALPAAAAPLFLSSARAATLHRAIATTCPGNVGPTVSSNLPFSRDNTTGTPVAGTDGVRPRSGTWIYQQRGRILAASTPPEGLAAPITTLYTGAAAVVPGGGVGNMPVTLLSRDGFRDHVAVVAGPSGEGAWIPDSLTELSGLTVGSRLIITRQVPTGRPGETVRVDRPLRVAAVYHDLRRAPDTPYWCPLKYVYRGLPGQAEGNQTIPALVLTDAPRMLDLGSTFAFNETQTVEYRLADPRLSQPDAAHLGRTIMAWWDRLTRAQPRVFRDDYILQSSFHANIGRFAGRAELVRRALLPPVLPVTGAGVLVGLVVVGAAGVFWVQRRRTELTVLAVHGAGPVALGVKAIAEALPALLAGSAAGAWVARVLVGWAGPSPRLSAEAVPLSLAATGASLPLAAMVLATAAAAGIRGLVDAPAPGRASTRAMSRPWELALPAAAVPLWFALGGSTELTSAPGTLGSVAEVPARLLVVPIMVIAGLAALGARSATGWLRGRGRRLTPRRTAPFVAWRRTTREAAAAATLAAAVAIPAGLACYGATVTGSVRATMAAQARVSRGADVVLTLSRPAAVPPSLAEHATALLRLYGVQVDGLQADLLAIDPDTFARGAFWDDRIDGTSLASIVAMLRPHPQTGADPETGAGGSAPALAAVGSGQLPTGTYQMTRGNRTIGTARLRHAAVLPAQQGGYPVVIVDRDALPAAALAPAVPQMWVSGDAGQILRDAVAARLPLARTDVADEAYADTLFEPVTFTFDYLVALSLFTGGIATVGLLLYLEGRTPRQRRAYPMLRRMGLRRRAHLTAMVLEVSPPLVTGLVAGVGLAAATVLPLARFLDINPGVPPGTVLRAPTGQIGAIVAATVGVGLLASWYAHYRVTTAAPMEVLRDTR